MGFFPDLFRALGCGGKKTGVTGIGRVVFLDKIADIDLFLPDFTAKSIPCSVAVKLNFPGVVIGIVWILLI